MEENIFTSNTNIRMNESLSDVYNNVSGLSLQRLFYALYHQYPSSYFFSQDGRSTKIIDVRGLADYLLKNTPEDEKLELIQYVTENLDSGKKNYSCSFVFHKSQLLMRTEISTSETYILFLNQNKEELDKLIEVVKKFYIEEEDDDKENFFTLSQDSNGFHLLKQKVKQVKDFDIELQYNDDFIDADDILRDFIETDGKSGLVFLHGDKGTGKTTYIRHLINEYPEFKFVSIPPSLVDCLAEPAFTQFMHNNLHDTIIILEDCENIIKNRAAADGRSNGVSTLLNIGDGLLSDDLGIKFICTFNYSNMIDEALTRKGRLALKYEFKNLSADKVKELIPIVVENKIAEYNEDITEYLEDEIDANNEKERQRIEDKIERLKKKIEKLKNIPEYTSPTAMSLADIYNIEEESFIKEKKQIGF